MALSSTKLIGKSTASVSNKMRVWMKCTAGVSLVLIALLWAARRDKDEREKRFTGEKKRLNVSVSGYRKWKVVHTL